MSGYELPPIREFLSLSFKCSSLILESESEHLRLVLNYKEGTKLSKEEQENTENEDGLKIIKVGVTVTQPVLAIAELADFTQEPIPVEFIFERHQEFKIILINDNDEIRAQGKFKLSEIVTAGEEGKVIQLNKPDESKFCDIDIRYAIMGAGNRTEFHIDLKAFEVKNVDKFSASDPFLVIFRPSNEYILEKDGTKVPEDKWIKILQTEYIIDNENPNFKPFKIDGRSLCRGMENTAFKVEIWDYSLASNQRISKGYFSLYSHLMHRRDIETFDDEGAISGIIILDKFERRDYFSIAQHITQGMTINLVAGIDYTASNGNPANQSSLHYINPLGVLNQYQSALKNVITVLEVFDTDKEIPLYGFGGLSPSLGIKQTSHCFPLTGDVNKTSVIGSDGVLELYQSTLGEIKLSGPTYFAPLINESIKHVQHGFKRGLYSYTILLILTDGSICDMEETISSIEKASKLPISIIIIGLGEEDYSSMKILDGDEDYQEHGFKPARDIVQFVPYRDFAGDSLKLSQQVLSEIPDQIAQFWWMTTNGISSIK